MLGGGGRSIGGCGKGDGARGGGSGGLAGVGDESLAGIVRLKPDLLQGPLSAYRPIHTGEIRVRSQYTGGRSADSGPDGSTCMAGGGIDRTWLYGEAVRTDELLADASDYKSEMSQTSAVASSPAETTERPSGVKSTAFTGPR